MHHMDMHSIFQGSRNKLTLSPEQLDKLDYLVFQLKQHGVYVNLNLHVSRWLDEAEGFSGRAERPEFRQGARQLRAAHDRSFKRNTPGTC